MVIASKALSVLFKNDQVKEELKKDEAWQNETQIVGNVKRRRLSFDAADGMYCFFKKV